MSWRDKVQAMREGKNSQKCLNPSVPKLTELGFGSFGTPPPTPFQEKTGFSGHEAKAPDPAPGLQIQPHAAPPGPVQPPAPAPGLHADSWDYLPVPDKPALDLDKSAKMRRDNFTAWRWEYFMDWRDGWIEQDRAYQHHHFNCPVCIAAGKGYGLRCGTGAALHMAYSDAAERPEKKGRP